MNSIITPIFISGSARNGTTNLENTVAALPQVAGIEHWLHYGSHESNLYKNKKYWGDLSDVNNYISFLYQYSSSDYFSLCNGDIEYHLKHKRNNFYNFFFDLMDHYARREGKAFWITKLDQKFFMDKKERKKFFQILNSRYTEVKVIRIKRNFEDAFRSYINMEGQSYKMRQWAALMMPELMLQASRYTLTYNVEVEELNNIAKVEINFDKYITNRVETLMKLATYLEIPVNDVNELSLDSYQVNTSFVKRSKKELPQYIIYLIPFFIKLYQSYPTIARFVWKTYYGLKKKSYPIFHRILYFKYFQDQLIQELKHNNAMGLLEKIDNEGFISGLMPENDMSGDE